MNEAELLFTDILNCDRQSLYLNRDLRLGEDKFCFVSSVLKRRLKGEPIQYILGKTEFMGLEFMVTPEVFIPRPETEILVETAIEIGRRFQAIGHRLNILDIGTGSGNVAISLAKFLPQAKVYATDISDKALRVAKINARFHNLENRIKFIQSDLFTTYYLLPTTCYLIVCNPPYIPTLDIERLQPEISYEPTIALDGGKDGLEFYRKIINDAPHYLKDGGFLILEMGFGQKDAIKNIFQKTQDFEIINEVKDYSNIDRVIIAQKKDG